jgi:pimeloyl-ACP methyl ester carboxylesterase
MEKLTEQTLQDKSNAILTDFDSPSDTLFISFAGVGMGMGVPIFEFYNLWRELDVKKIYVRDTEKMFFHTGLKDFSDSLEDTVTKIKALIQSCGAKRVVTFGNSMGGYACALYGYLLEADEIHAFAPTTVVGPIKRMIMFDTRAWQYHVRLYQNPKAQWKYFDLRSLINPKVKLNIHYDGDYRVDRWHAKWMRKRGGNVHLFPYHIGGGHRVIRNLKKSGDLKRILSEAITGEPVEAK